VRYSPEYTVEAEKSEVYFTSFNCDNPAKAEISKIVTSPVLQRSTTKVDRSAAEII